MMKCPHCSIPHDLEPNDDCPACGDSLGRDCYDCGHFFFDLVPGVAVPGAGLRAAEVCEDCASSRKRTAAKDKRREIEEGRGDWQRDQQRGEP